MCSFVDIEGFLFTLHFTSKASFFSTRKVTFFTSEQYLKVKAIKVEDGLFLFPVKSVKHSA